MMNPKDMALTIAKALDDKKGQDIKVLETGALTTLADYFVLCTATSSTQIKALGDECEKVMKEAGELPHHIEGHRGGHLGPAGLLLGGGPHLQRRGPEGL